MYRLLPMKNTFMTNLYRFVSLKMSRYLVTNTTLYSSCVLKEMPLAERDIVILWMRIKIEARWAMSPKRRKIFIVGGVRWCDTERASRTSSDERGFRAICIWISRLYSQQTWKVEYRWSFLSHLRAVRAARPAPTRAATGGAHRPPSCTAYSNLEAGRDVSPARVCGGIGAKASA